MPFRKAGAVYLKVPEGSRVDVELLVPARYAEAGAVLARAFYSDPVWSYLCPDAWRRRTHLAWLFERWARVVAPLGAGYITRGGEGVAVWLPPEHGPDVGLWTLVRAGLVWAPLRFGLGWLRRSAAIAADLARRQRADLDEPHWILDVLGVDPDCQRSGVGSALLAPVLARADAEALPCYVITHNPANVAYYQRFGFELLHVPDSHPRAISLRRPARTRHETPL